MGSSAGCCYDEAFDDRHAQRRLDEYRRRGARRSTQRLIAALAADGIDGATVLDIGGGVGAVHLGLLDAGAAAAVDVDASGPLLAAARDEALRLGLADRVAHHRGDFVALANELPKADVVALDKVICCYPDDAALLAAAASHARMRIGLVLPRDAWWTRAAGRLLNSWQWLRRDRYRFYVHRAGDIDAVLRSAGLELVHLDRGWVWQVEVHERVA